MKITHFVENLERGGLERVVISLVLAQHEAGHDCQVICLFEQGVLAAELLAQGVAVHVCGKRSGFDLRALRRARALLAARKGGVLHTHNDMAHYYATLASVGLGMKCIVNTRHSMSSRNAASARREWLYRRSMLRTDYAVAVCEAARVRLAQEGVKPRSQLLTIPNGLHIEGFEAANAKARQRLAGELGLAPGTRIVGTVGRLNPVKDQATLIHAFAKAHARIPGCALVLAGDGALRRELEATAVVEGVSHAVHFLGARNDVPRLLQGFDLFVLSSLTEGYSMALLEACASALPIIATDVGGNAEIVRENWNGHLVPSGEPNALADAIIGMLSLDHTKLVDMGARGREWMLDEGTFARMQERYARIYSPTICIGTEVN